MTTLDQAFIKAFSRQGAVPLPPSSRSTAPVKKKTPLPLGVGQSEVDLVWAALEKPPRHEKQEMKTVARETRDERSSTGVERPQTPPDSILRGLECQTNRPLPVEISSQETFVTGGPWIEAGQWTTDSESCGLDVLVATPTIEPEPIAAQPVELPPPPPPAPAVAEHHSVLVEETLPAELPPPTAPAAVENNSVSVEEAQPAELPPPPAPPVPPSLPTTTSLETAQTTTFKPAWQVDRFTWPKVCRRLIGRAAGELDRLADALLTAHASGHKVVAVAGCRQGEGATTLLLCAARRLAERGIKAVLVDADRTRPRLAKRLGVQPQLGWDEVSGDEAASLSQAVVEATSNNLAIVPLGDPTDHGNATPGDWSRFGPCLEVLRDHYEMVLVDPGPLENPNSVLDAPSATAGGKIDAVLLVHNQRISSETDLGDAERRLDAAGIAVMGLIENFVVS